MASMPNKRMQVSVIFGLQRTLLGQFAQTCRILLDASFAYAVTTIGYGGQMCLGGDF